MRISVIIPCRNEAASIERVIQAIPEQVSEIIVVDNNSADQTARRAAKLGARVIFESKPGYGRAIRKGLGQARGDILAVLDGDGQYPAEEILPLAECLRRCRLDFVSASRFPLTDPAAMGKVRRWGNWGLTLVVNLLFGLRLRDSQSGMWVFRREILGRLALESRDMSFSEEIKIRSIRQLGARFKEQPISYSARTGQSKLLPLRHGLKNLLFLLKLWRQHRSWPKQNSNR